MGDNPSMLRSRYANDNFTMATCESVVEYLLIDIRPDFASGELPLDSGLEIIHMLKRTADAVGASGIISQEKVDCNKEKIQVKRVVELPAGVLRMVLMSSLAWRFGHLAGLMSPCYWREGVLAAD